MRGREERGNPWVAEKGREVVSRHGLREMLDQLVGAVGMGRGLCGDHEEGAEQGDQAGVDSGEVVLRRKGQGK